MTVPSRNQILFQLFLRSIFFGCILKHLKKIGIIFDFYLGLSHIDNLLLYRYDLAQPCPSVFSNLPYKWLFSRVVYFTNGPSFLISRMAAGDHIFLILVKYFKDFIFHELSLYRRNS